MPKKPQYTGLKEGIRVQYKDRNEATRQGRIVARHGNTITVVGALKSRARVSIGNVVGYWQARVKASPYNLVRLKN